jgi:MFS family permease
VLRRYREILGEPHIARLLVTAMVGRLPQGMSSLAILLLLTPGVGYGKAGLATGLSVATSGASNVLVARAVDRLGARAVLVPAATGYAALTVVLALVARHSYPASLLVCALLGVTAPPVSSVARGMWPRLLGDERSQVVYGLEATAQELVFIVGPAGVALVAGTAGSRVALLMSGGLCLLGVLGFVSSPAFAGFERPQLSAGRHVPLWRTRVMAFTAIGTCLTMGFGMTEIATVAFVSGRHATAAAGVVLAIWSGGSLVGGLVFGAGAAQVTDRGLGVSLVLAGAGIAVSAAAPGKIALAVILFVGAMGVAPALARVYTRLGAIAPSGTRTEAFGWLSVGFQVGSSLGAALGGLCVEGLGARAAFLIAGAAALLSVLAVPVRRAPSPAPTPG